MRLSVASCPASDGRPGAAGAGRGLCWRVTEFVLFAPPALRPLGGLGARGAQRPGPQQQGRRARGQGRSPLPSLGGAAPSPASVGKFVSHGLADRVPSKAIGWALP